MIVRFMSFYKPGVTVDDGGLAGPPGDEVLKRPHLPRHLHRVCEFCKSDPIGEVGQGGALPLA